MSLGDRSPDRALNTTFSARRLAIMAALIALSAVGSFIKIPGPLGSIALDAAPGFFAALGFGAWPGFLVIAIGHLLSASLTGFPLSLPVHIAIAIGMGGCALLFRWLGRRSRAMLVVALVVTALANSLGLGLILLPIGGWGMYLGAIPSLLLGAVVNLAIAALAYLSLRNSRLLDS